MQEKTSFVLSKVVLVNSKGNVVNSKSFNGGVDTAK